MSAFVLIAAVMIVVAVACVLVPLLRGGKPAGIAREASNVEVLRDQLAELDADLASGAMPRERYEEARREIELRVLEDVKTAAPRKAPPTQSAAWTAAILAGTIPVVGGRTYRVTVYLSQCWDFCGDEPFVLTTSLFPPGAAVPIGCRMSSPVSGWVCINGDWMPPDHPEALAAGS